MICASGSSDLQVVNEAEKGNDLVVWEKARTHDRDPVDERGLVFSCVSVQK